jgi:hypothetical protein
LLLFSVFKVLNFFLYGWLHFQENKWKVGSDNQCCFFSVQISYIFRIKMTPRRLPLISATGALTDLRYSTGLAWFTMD